MAGLVRRALEWLPRAFPGMNVRRENASEQPSVAELIAVDGREERLVCVRVGPAAEASGGRVGNGS